MIRVEFKASYFSKVQQLLDAPTKTAFELMIEGYRALKQGNLKDAFETWKYDTKF